MTTMSGPYLRAAVLSDLDEGVTAFSPHVSTLELSGFFGGSVQSASYRGMVSILQRNGEQGVGLAHLAFAAHGIAALPNRGEIEGF